MYIKTENVQRRESTRKCEREILPYGYEGFTEYFVCKVEGGAWPTSSRVLQGSDMRVTKHEYPISPATTGCTRDRLIHHEAREVG